MFFCFFVFFCCWSSEAPKPIIIDSARGKLEEHATRLQYCAREREREKGILLRPTVDEELPLFSWKEWIWKDPKRQNHLFALWPEPCLATSSEPARACARVPANLRKLHLCAAPGPGLPGLPGLGLARVRAWTCPGPGPRPGPGPTRLETSEPRDLREPCGPTRPSSPSRRVC